MLVILDFEIVRQGIVVDEILRSRELYLDGRRRTDRSDKSTRSNKIRVVVPDTKFGPIWEQLLVKALAAQAEALGTTPRHAETIARDSIRRWRTGPH
jgi:hypothetical protein